MWRNHSDSSIHPIETRQVFLGGLSEFQRWHMFYVVLSTLQYQLKPPSHRLPPWALDDSRVQGAPKKNLDKRTIMVSFMKFMKYPKLMSSKDPLLLIEAKHQSPAGCKWNNKQTKFLQKPISNPPSDSSISTSLESLEIGIPKPLPPPPPPCGLWDASNFQTSIVHL